MSPTVEVGATGFDSKIFPSMDTLLDCFQGLIAVDKAASTHRSHWSFSGLLCRKFVSVETFLTRLDIIMYSGDLRYGVCFTSFK